MKAVNDVHHDIIDNRREILVDHINLILSSTEALEIQLVATKPDQIARTELAHYND